MSVSIGPGVGVGEGMGVTLGAGVDVEPGALVATAFGIEVRVNDAMGVDALVGTLVDVTIAPCDVAVWGCWVDVLFTLFCKEPRENT